MMERDGVFRKAGGSGDHGCVEVAADRTRVRVRDSKRPEGDPLKFSDHEWKVFVGTVKDGQFDLD